MIFSASATHALRALAHLAAGEGDEATLGRDLARKVQVPSHYLAKVLATLARTGVLTASRGVRGGYRLARPARHVRLLDIVEPFEGKRARPGCLLRPDEPCREGAACSAHAAWSDAKATYLRFLETTTLADIQGVDARQSKAGRARSRVSRTHRGGSAMARRRT
jgi:Rrf2 family protein